MPEQDHDDRELEAFVGETTPSVNSLCVVLVQNPKTGRWGRVPRLCGSILDLMRVKSEAQRVGARVKVVDLHWSEVIEPDGTQVFL